MRPREGDDRGAVAIIVAVASVLILGVAAYCVDIGRQRVVRTDMQSTADTASLDMARALANGTVPGTSAWTAALRASIDGDSATLGHATAVPAAWDATMSVCNAKLCAEAMPGYVDIDTQFTTTPPADATTYDAVRVTTTAAVDRGLSSVIGSGSLPATRAAVATTRSNACFKVGSYAAALQSNDGAMAPLLGLLGTHADLTVLGSDGIATTDVTAAQFLAAVATAGGTVDGVTGSASLRQILKAEASLLPAASQPYLDLQQILGDNAAILGRTVDLTQVVDLAAGGSSALEAVLNLGDILGGSLAVANGTNSIALDDYAADFGFLAIHGDAWVTQPAQLACGPAGTSASSVQIMAGPVTLTPDSATVADLEDSVSGLDLAGLSVSIADTTPGDTALTLKLASATGQLAQVRCDPDGIDVTVMHNQALETQLTTEITVSATVSLGLLGLVHLSLPYTVTTYGEPDSTAPVSIPIDLGDAADYDTPHDTGSGTLGLGTPSAQLDPSWTATIAGADAKHLLPAGLIAGLAGGGGLGSEVAVAVAATINTAVETGVLAPLGRLLGLTIPGAQVYAELPRPDCGNPRLTQ